MLETLETVLIYLWDYILWWPFLIFIAFCITTVISPKNIEKEEDFEEYLK